MRNLLVLAATGCGGVYGLEGGEAIEEVEPPEPEARFAFEDAAIEISPAPGAHDWSPGVDIAWVFDQTTDGMWCTFAPRPSACAELSEPEEIALGGAGSSIGTYYACLCADVTCIDKADGAVLATWSWDLGRVCVEDSLTAP